jgi:hypothetical protein
LHSRASSTIFGDVLDSFIVIEDFFGGLFAFMAFFYDFFGDFCVPFLEDIFGNFFAGSPMLVTFALTVFLDDKNRHQQE